MSQVGIEEPIRGFRFSVYPEDLFGSRITRIEFHGDKKVTFWRAAAHSDDTWSVLKCGPCRATVEIEVGENPSRGIKLTWLSVVEYIPVRVLDAAKADILEEGLLCKYEDTTTSVTA